MLKYQKHLSSGKNATITEGTGNFAHCRLPMGKKNNILCVLRASVVKQNTR